MGTIADPHPDRTDHPAGAVSWRSVLKQFPLFLATAAVGAVAGILALSGLTSPAAWLVIVFAGAVGLYLAVGMVRDLLRGHAGIDILAVTAIASTLAVGEFTAAMVVVLMITGGEGLEDYAGARAKRELTALLAGAPNTAHLVDGRDIRDVPADDVAPGDTLLIRPSEVVPVDGVLLSAAATFDESSLTGESLPVERVEGEQVLSGAVNGTAAITITATATAADSQYAQIIELVRAAAASKSRMVRLADRYAVPFTLLAYAIAGAAWIASGSATRFAAVLVVATPCPLLIAAPVAFLGGMSRAARRGIIVKTAAALEVASRVRTVAFDKTGTLTIGRPTLLDVRPAGGLSADRLLALAAAAELFSSHVLAASITQAARDRNLVIPSGTDGRERATDGVSATIDGHEIRVGKADFVAEVAAVPPAPDLSRGELAVHVGVDDTYAGTLLLADPPRPESERTIRRLHSLGVAHTLIVTGDAEPTARAVAEQVGVSDVRAQCLPADKVAVVRAETRRPVMMVGDGVNDAPVLAAADVGVALGARGATAAAQSADVVIMRDRLDLVADTVAIGRRTILVAVQSIWLGIGLSVALMVVAAFGLLAPVWGALSQEAIDLAAIGNALRALMTPAAERDAAPGGPEQEPYDGRHTAGRHE